MSTEADTAQPRDYAAELRTAKDAGDWASHERIWEERRVGSVEADEFALEDEYAPGDKVIYRGEPVEVDSRYENSGDYLVLCADGYYRQANPLALSRPAGLPDETAERSALVGGVQFPGTAPWYTSAPAQRLLASLAEQDLQIVRAGFMANATLKFAAATEHGDKVLAGLANLYAAAIAANPLDLIWRST